MTCFSGGERRMRRRAIDGLAERKDVMLWRACSCRDTERSLARWRELIVRHVWAFVGFGVSGGRLTVRLNPEFGWLLEDVFGDGARDSLREWLRERMLGPAELLRREAALGGHREARVSYREEAVEAIVSWMEGRLR